MRAIRPKLRSHAREHIVTIDTDSAPRLFFSGENLLIRFQVGPAQAVQHFERNRS